MRRFIVCGTLSLVCLTLGFAASWYLKVFGAKQSATASIYLTSEYLRSGDLVYSMLYAQKVIHDAPSAYDGYLLAGEIYHRQGIDRGSIIMYELAMQKLDAGGAKAMLVENSDASVEAAREVLRQKLALVRERATD